MRLYLQKMSFVLLGFFPTIGYGSDLPLFASDEVIDITFEVPMETIIDDAERRPVVAGVLHYTNNFGQDISLQIEMNTRGKTRLAYCSFPPLKINLKRKETEGTLFEGQNKLKVVTHCRKGPTFERYLHQEFGIYGAFNVVAGRSFRVRMLRVTYRDSSGERDDEVHPAFFVESDNEVAARFGMVAMEVEQVNPSQLDSAHAIKLALFQYLIGGTDWSTLRGPENGNCCHNSKPIAAPGAQNGWFALPYDFDQVGLIDPYYSETLGMRDLRKRVFRGRCRNLDYLGDAIMIFNERRAAIEAELLPAAVEGRHRKSAIRYINDFYEVINDPKDRRDEIDEECVGRR